MAFHMIGEEITVRVTIEPDRLIIRNLKPGDEHAVFAWADDPDDYDLGFVLKETGELIGGGGLVYHYESCC